ncbi:hypothetical protein NFI96_004759 [Prochilodus magdalenae]|nr:hypothetical protein NFI96_004759 [Prochilodus magdalenae]
MRIQGEGVVGLAAMGQVGGQRGTYFDGSRDHHKREKLTGSFTPTALGSALWSQKSQITPGEIVVSFVFLRPKRNAVGLETKAQIPSTEFPGRVEPQAAAGLPAVDMLVSYSSSSSEEESEDTPGHNRKRQRPNGKDVTPPLRKRECVGDKTGTESRTFSEGVEGTDKKRETSFCQSGSRLPLPVSLLDMFEDSEEQHVDDCSQHGGRLRSFQHERGNWATHVYLPYEPDDVFLELLEELRVGAEAHGVFLTLAEEFHVSVSRTVILRHHWIQPFVQSLRTGLAQCRRFVCLAGKLKVYTNDERTRTFLGMEISTGHVQLLEAAKTVDKTMEEFNLGTFYKDPSFHVSLAWCVGDLAEKLQGTCLSELQLLVDGHEDGPFQIRLNCNELRCKTGNKVFLLPLQ